MKRKILIVAFFILFLPLGVFAKTIKVLSLDEFSTEYPSSTYSVQTIQQEVLQDGTVIEEGTVISGHVLSVQNAKRLKRDGYFEFIPTTFMYRGEYINNIPSGIVARVVDYEPLEPQEFVLSVAKKAAGFAVKGATQGISFVEGVVKADEGERLKSGIVKVYKDSPLSYIEAGSELYVKRGDVLVLQFKKLK